MILPVLLGALLGATARTAPGAAQDSITYSGDIAAILHERCAGCHRPEGSGPFTLLDYADARRRAKTLLDVVERGLMPPWPPLAEHGGPFEGERRVTADELARLRTWVENGSPEGDPAGRPAAPVFPTGWRLGEPDLVLCADEPFVLAAEGRDVYRNLVLPVGVEETRYVQAFELLPGNARILHHAVVMVDRTGSVRELDRADPGPGFDGMRLGNAEVPDGHFLAWAPGRLPSPGYPGLAWTLEPGMDLVVQLHMRPTGKPEEIRPQIGLTFASEPPRERPVALTLAALEIDIPPGEADYRVRSEYVLPIDVRVLSVFPHTHYLGRDLRAYAEAPEGKRQWLLRIDPWDFDWQDGYRYVEPPLLAAGTRIVMDYHYDNSAENPENPNSPPKRVLYGEQSSDEMGELLLEVLPVDASQRARLQADFRLDKMKGTLGFYRTVVARDPSNLPVQKSLGLLCLRLGLTEEAREHLGILARVRPDDPIAHRDLGNALLAGGKLAEAKASFELALRLAPTDPGLRTNLGVACFRLGELPRARELLEEALRQAADQPKTLLFLGAVLARQGEAQAARERLERALELDPNEGRAHLWLAQLARKRGDEPAALRHEARARDLELAPR